MQPNSIPLFDLPVNVEYEAIIDQIEAFNKAGRNPFGPNVPVRGHAPLTFIMEGPGIQFELGFYIEDRKPIELAFLCQFPFLETRHTKLYPMTRAMIARQWHRVYQFDVSLGVVTDAKLLVGRKQDPDLFRLHRAPSAWPWVNALKASKEPVAFGESLG